MPVKFSGDNPAAKLTVEQKAVKDLKEYPNNPRKNDSAVPRMVKLIQKFGFRQPILVRGDEIVDGHLRIKAAKKLNMSAVPAIDVSDLPEPDVRALRLAMNKSVEWASWDDELLAEEFKALQAEGFELAFTGFAEDTINKILADAMAEDSTSNVTKTALADAGNPADPNYVSLTFHMTAESRKKVLAHLDAVAEETGLANRSQALIHICKG